MIWLSNVNGGKLALLGQPCHALGEMTYAAREQIVTCRQTESGLAWQ